MHDERTCPTPAAPAGDAAPDGLPALIARMDAMEAAMIEQGDARRYFHSTYLRTTRAVGEAHERGHFVDADWVERWDVVFAALYLDAVDLADAGEAAPEPWRVAFEAAVDPTTPPLRLTLLGMNAHINYDLAQSLVAVITPAEFDDPATVERRSEDHRRIDAVLASRVRAEDRELAKVEPPGSRTLLDRLLTPLNTAGTKRFLAESRAKVWRNARLLDAARRQDDAAYAARLDELAALSAARVADLARPGQVILRLARDGFGVELSG